MDSPPAHTRRAIPVWALGLIATVAIAAAYWAIFSRAFLNYDTLYALIWGRELAHGRLPDYDVTLAPTPHPLAELVGLVASLTGTDAGYTLLLAVAMLSFGALLVGLFLLGRACFGWQVGLVAVAVVATSVPFLSFGMRAYVDIPFLALIVFAAVLEARAPRRGPSAERPEDPAGTGWEGRSGGSGAAAVLVLLALAGLLRPEAWLLSLAYYVYLWPALDRGAARAAAGALVLVAPAAWLLSDLVIAGDALHSLTATRETSRTLERPRGILEVPEIMPRRLGEILRIVPLIGGTIGFALGLIYLRRRSLLPAALAVLGGLGFVALGVAGLSLLGRYLFGPAAMIAIFFGVACFGWLCLAPANPTGVTLTAKYGANVTTTRPARRNWAIFGIVSLLVWIASSVAHQTPRLRDLRDGIQYRGAVEEDLRDLARSGTHAGNVLRRCTIVYVPNHRPVPILAWYVDRPPADFRSAAIERPSRGGWILPANARVRDRFVLDRNDPHPIRVPLVPPAGWQLIARNSSWKLYERAC